MPIWNKKWLFPKLEARDWDHLFPWLIFSVGANFLLWGYALSNVDHLLSPQKNFVSITEVPIPQKAAATRTSKHQSRPSTHRDDRQVVRSARQSPYIVPDITHQKAYDAYLKHWEEHILTAAQKVSLSAESVQLHGTIVVAITIAPNGHLKEISLLRGSKNKALVTAVETVIRYAAPFDPLPTFWQTNGTSLQIVRTWNFNVQNHLVAADG